MTEKETRIIDVELFRRMQFIKQLSHAYLVYPSAVHTRFEHLLGTMHVAGIMSDRLDLRHPEKEAVRLASLLHDIGHGPFSHLFEHVMSKLNSGDGIHEKISGIMINEDADILDALGESGDAVLEILGHKERTGLTSRIQSNIVSGSLDADKMDYLRRDSYHIGVKYGEFDFERMMRSIVISKNFFHSPEDRAVSNLCLGPKGIHVVESFRLARYMMHVQVYEHHARLSADQMFLRALNIAIDNSTIDGNLLEIKKDGNNTEFLEFYKSLNDSSIYQMIINKDPDGIPAKILKDIQRRNLLKRACEFTSRNLSGRDDVFDWILKGKPEELDAVCSKIAEQVRVPEHQVIFHVSKINNKSYADPIPCQTEDDIFNLDSVSPISGSEKINRVYVFGPPSVDVRQRIAQAIAGVFDVDVENISTLRPV